MRDYLYTFSCILRSHKCGIIFTRFLTFIRWRKSSMFKISFLCMNTPTRTCVLVSNWFCKTMSLYLWCHMLFGFCASRGFWRQNLVHTLLAWFLPSRSQPGRNSLSRRLGWKDVDFLPCNRNLMVRKFQRCYEFWFISIFYLNFLGIFRFDLLHQDFNRVFLELSKINRLNQINRFGFSHQRVNRKLYICREGIDWEVFNLILVLK